MSNEFTRLQIQTWLQKAYESAKNPDKREELRRERKKKAQKIAKRFGL